VDERTAASQVGLYPYQYITVKEAMMRESCRAGGLKKKDAKLLCTIGTCLLLFIYIISIQF